MSDLTNKKVAFLLTDGFEDSELTSPWEAVKQAGATPVLVSPEKGTVSGKKGHEQEVDQTSAAVSADEFAGLVLPGGVENADDLRLDEASVKFTRAFFDAGKPVAAICHAAWILAEADVLQGRTLTSFPSLRTDLENAGATWVDEEVHVDQGLVSSRTPDDLPAFNAKLVEELKEGKHEGQTA